eukprot:gnl/TRDRNA2_/TRDRNA2_132197_c0_seq2.p1 gnl/TRDRNA2_/TRDRNA2_132197_c0~~gnl/TRDRNA2_/TRDRNA2_132197_c0_seq2.p1  ORF type:complete len:575 (-),score=138.46 gnl/TRDRNA2_/TRDRNA2_132197_c0_seq2:42-1766(-)
MSMAQAGYQGEDVAAKTRDLIMSMQAQGGKLSPAEKAAEEEKNAAAMDMVFGQETEPYLSPLQKNYFTSELLVKYEPCVEALKRFIHTEGKTLEEQEDAWEAFDEHWQKWMDMSCFSKWDGNKYDFVMYGVSGYTGYLMMEYLKRVAFKRTSEKFTFAFAGRTPSKVAEMKDKEFGGTAYEDTPIIQASYDDPQSVIDMCKSAHVILNVAGPYMLTQGEVLVDSCIHCGAHYVDINGEIPWIMRIKPMHEKAVERGVNIIPSGAPAGGYPDLLVFVAADEIRKKYDEPLRRSVGYVTGGGAVASPSGGTLASRAAMSSATDDERKNMADPFALGGFIPDVDRNGVKEAKIEQGTGFVTFKHRKEDMDAQLSKISEDTINGIWRAPHTYAYFDTRKVRRTNKLLAERLSRPYGIEFNFQEFTIIDPAAATGFMGTQAPEVPDIAAMPTQQEEKEYLEKLGKYYKQGEGPSVEELGDAWTCWFNYAESPTGNQSRQSMCGGDGYFETARASIEICQTLCWDELQMRGGMLTVTACGGMAWIERLKRSGIKWKDDGWFQPSELGPPPGTAGQPYPDE